MRKRDEDLETWQCIYLLDIRTVRERLKTGHKNRFRGEFFNLLNEAHFSFPNGTINQPVAGVSSSAVDSARQIQFGLKLIF